MVWAYVAGILNPPVPNLLVDHPAFESRILPMAIKSMGLEGWLHWSVAEWEDAKSGHTWVDRYRRTMTTVFENGLVNTGNGDGWLFYPPTRSAPKRTYISAPVISQRWEMIREGMEDVDALALLGSLVADARTRDDVSEKTIRRAETLLSIPNEIAWGRSHWTRDLESFDAYRLRVLRAIDELSIPN